VIRLAGEQRDAASAAFQRGSSRPAATALPIRTSGILMSRCSLSRRSASSASSMRMNPRPASRQALDVSSATARTPRPAMNRRSSAGARGLRVMSTNWTSIRRSLKNRRAARVGCEPGVPKTWMVDPAMAGG
jgi:hypothetical protein